ncbi:MAG: glycosyltransferase, partial [Gammaproteobacteria bacterium]
MANQYVLILFFFMWYLLVVVSFLFIISGIDDLFFDFFYWFRYFRRIRKTRNYEPLTYEVLSKTPEKAIAIMTPCWHEANIIEAMLKHNCYAIDYKNYDIFVGVYPNDPDTVKSVQAVAATDSHVHCVIGPNPGPTNKASNLNIIYEYIKNYSKENNITYEIFVLHDSEDIIHPLSLKLYNHLIPRVDMIQIPVFPLEVSNFEFTHWVYNDEFAESHTKDIIVRESIRGLVPSAGVGTAFARIPLESLTVTNGGKPFSTATLTEDYSTALQLRAAG